MHVTFAVGATWHHTPEWSKPWGHGGDNGVSSLTVSTDVELEVGDTSDPVKVVADLFHYTQLGGDQLTCAWGRGSQAVRINAKQGNEQLEGIIPVMEDWQAKGILLEVNIKFLIP